jgi:hypothetical protein
MAGTEERIRKMDEVAYGVDLRALPTSCLDKTPHDWRFVCNILGKPPKSYYRCQKCKQRGWLPCGEEPP